MQINIHLFHKYFHFFAHNRLFCLYVTSFSTQILPSSHRLHPFNPSFNCRKFCKCSNRFYFGTSWILQIFSPQNGKNKQISEFFAEKSPAREKCTFICCKFKIFFVPLQSHFYKHPALLRSQRIIKLRSLTLN